MSLPAAITVVVAHLLAVILPGPVLLSLSWGPV